MADQEQAPNTQTAADQQPDQQVASGQPTTPATTFSQADIDRIVKDRLEREKAKYADYETLKQAAAKLAELQAAQMSEDEKRSAKLKELEERASALEKERDNALQQANDRLIRSAFVSEASKAGAEHPDDAYMLADKASVSIGENGEVLGVAEAVKALVTAGRLPMRKSQQMAPNTNGAASGAPPSTLPVLTQEQEAAAKRMGIKPEVYAKRLAETQNTRR